MEFHKGDIVRVVGGFNDEMIGRNYTVKRIAPMNARTLEVVSDDGKAHYVGIYDAFKVSEFTVKTDFKKSVRVTFEDGHTGEAHCCPSDTFDLGTGIKLAYSRAIGKHIPCLGQSYYVPDITMPGLVNVSHWSFDDGDLAYLKRNMVFETREEAYKMAKKMLDMLGGEQ